MNALQFDVSTVFLEFEVNSFTEIDFLALTAILVKFRSGDKILINLSI